MGTRGGLRRGEPCGPEWGRGWGRPQRVVLGAAEAVGGRPWMEWAYRSHGAGGVGPSGRKAPVAATWLGGGWGVLSV